MLYERYLDEIYRFVYLRVSDTLEAEDITENAFLKTWEHLPKLSAKGDQIDNFRAWLYRTALNLVIDYYRSKKPLALKDDFPAKEQDSPEAFTDLNLLSQQLANAIKELSPDFQQIIILRFVNQLSHQEAALMMNRSYGHVRVLQHRALKKLKEILTKEKSQNGKDR